MAKQIVWQPLQQEINFNCVNCAILSNHISKTIHCHKRCISKKTIKTEILFPCALSAPQILAIGYWYGHFVHSCSEELQSRHPIPLQQVFSHDIRLLPEVLFPFLEYQEDSTCRSSSMWPKQVIFSDIDRFQRFSAGYHSS